MHVPLRGRVAAGLTGPFRNLPTEDAGVGYLGAASPRAVHTGWGWGSPRLGERGLGVGTAPARGRGRVSRRA